MDLAGKVGVGREGTRNSIRRWLSESEAPEYLIVQYRTTTALKPPYPWTKTPEICIPNFVEPNTKYARLWTKAL